MCLEGAQDVVTLGYPVVQWCPKLGPALVKPLFALQILTIEWHNGSATCAAKVTDVCVDVWSVYVLRGWYECI